MNKKQIGVLLGTLAFGTVAIAHAEDADKPAPKAEKKGKAKKGGDKDKGKDAASCGADKKGGAASCGADKKAK